MPAPPAALGPCDDAPGYEEAVGFDRADALAPFRDRFVETDGDLVYLDGNSLGRLPVRTPDHVTAAVEGEWGDRLIRSWKEGWWELATDVGDRLAPLIGAGPGEVVVADSTSVNLYKLAGAALAAGAGRARVVTDDLNFPSDAHVVAGLARAAGGRLDIVASDGIHGPVEQIEAALDDDVALVTLSHTTFKSGYTYDLARVTAAAHAAGALVLWDLSHSVGAVPVDLGGAGADLAVGCTYKYLNGGPGSPAFLYVRRELQDRLVNPISAWWGHADPFGFDLAHSPAPDIRRFQTGTAPILSLRAAEPGIDLVVEAGIDAIRAKSRALLAFFEARWRDRLAPLGLTWTSPTDPDRRGSHASLGHDDAWRLTQAMIELGRVIPDYRAPDSVRLGLSPLTTSFVDVHTATERMARILELGLHEPFPAEATVVT